MKELIANARNIAFVEIDDDTLSATVEIILITSEPQWQADGGGGMSKHRVAETLRFNAQPDALRQLAKNLNAYADEADKRVSHWYEPPALQSPATEGEL